MSAVLTVPAATLSFDDAGGGAAALENPVTVLLGAVTEAGAALSPTGLTTSGYRVSRRTAPAAPPEVWDDGTKAWLPDQPGTAAKPVALMYKAADANPWQGLLVAAGVKDGSGAPAFATAVNGYPVYTVAGSFTAADGVARDGHPSPSLTFASASDRYLLVIGPGDGEQPEQATQARLLLKSPARVVIGGLTIDRDSPGAVVRLATAAGASLVINPDGSIVLNPAPGHGVTVNGGVEVDGDLHARRLFRRPGGVGPEQEV